MPQLQTGFFYVQHDPQVLIMNLLSFILDH